MGRGQADPATQSLKKPSFPLHDNELHFRWWISILWAWKCKYFQVKLQICKAEDQILVYSEKKPKKNSVPWSATWNSRPAYWPFQERTKMNAVYWTLPMYAPDSARSCSTGPLPRASCVLSLQRGSGPPALEWRLVVPQYHRSVLLLDKIYVGLWLYYGKPGQDNEFFWKQYVHGIEDYIPRLYSSHFGCWNVFSLMKGLHHHKTILLLLFLISLLLKIKANNSMLSLLH